MNRLDQDWLLGRASLGAAAGWTTEEMRIVADLGYALAQQGRDTEAIMVFEGLAALAPATSYFQSALGALRLRAGELSQALKHLDAALDADEREIAALINRGEVHMRLGNQAAAIKDLRAVLNLTNVEPITSDSSPYIIRARALLARLIL